MPEPLTEEQLREYRELANTLESYLGPGLPIADLLDEVERLRAERAAFLALADAVTKDRDGPEEWLADRLWLRKLARDAQIPKEDS